MDKQGGRADIFGDFLHRSAGTAASTDAGQPTTTCTNRHHNRHVGGPADIFSGPLHGPPFLPSGAIFAAGREKRPRKPDFFSVSGFAVAAGPAAHVTPIQSRGPGARARRAPPTRPKP